MKDRRQMFRWDDAECSFLSLVDVRPVFTIFPLELLHYIITAIIMQQDTCQDDKLVAFATKVITI